MHFPAGRVRLLLAGVTEELPERLEISEIFESIQGEGPSTGRPGLFLRLAGCNLACDFCDTRYAWDWDRFDRHQESISLELDEIAERVRSSRTRRLIVTGGEPLLQQVALGHLLEGLVADVQVELETNGTRVPSPTLARHVAQFNVSAKLSNSGQPLERRLHGAALLALRDTEHAWLKLTVQTDADIEEADRLVSQLDWPPQRVCLMPLANSAQELHSRAPRVAAACVARGFTYSHRLQLELFEGRRGH